ncbi:MAG: DedA family protein [candidate division TM6 bacterium GW2011_GWF2_38_10]|nr:MAG: DedA family protein [candidate division TM6 bacterium GW2011_GWF2_38_10]
MGRKVHSPYAVWWLAALFFIESSFFIIPVENNKRSFYYARIATIASVIGGLFGYFIGAVLWQLVGPFMLKWIISKPTFYALSAKYKMYQGWAVLIAGFTPVPYKAVTISAGFCSLPLIPFIFYSTIARGARFFLVAGLIRVFGENAKVFIETYFNYLVVAFVLIVIGSCLVFT